MLYITYICSNLLVPFFIYFFFKLYLFYNDKKTSYLTYINLTHWLR